MEKRQTDPYRELLDSAKRVDRICDAFEKAWLAGDRPRIEAYLDGIPASEQRHLLEELLQVEFDVQLAQGVQPDRDQYVERFPECVALIDRVLKSDSTVKGHESSMWTSDSEPPTDAIEGFRIVKELSRGGQSVVYQAVQLSTKRKVALKVMLEGPFAGRGGKRRFEREIELIGSLHHPGIVPIYESGVSDGRYYYAMEYIRGRTLTKSVVFQKSELRDTLRLFARVCDAVDYSHQRGVIHRDLKPSNILVDDRGDPHVLDFGLAKIAGAEGAAQSLISLTGQIVGTPAYMSPEQAAGRPDEVDMRSDVYALGVILYELLTGQPPYDVTGSLGAVLQTIQQTQPKRPSLTGTPVNSEVETIVLKALDKEKQRRYDTAGALGRDIGRFLDGEPIEAKRDSLAYVLRKAVARYRVPAAIAASFLVLMIAASVALSLLYVRAETARAVAERAQAEAEEAQSAAEEAQADAVAARDQAITTSEDYRRLLYLSDMAAAQQAFLGQDIRHAVGLLKRHVPQGQTDLRRFEWYYLWGRCQRDRNALTCRVGERPRENPFVVKLSPDGTTLAVGCDLGRLELWDMHSPEHPQRRLSCQSRSMDGYTDLAFSPDGRWLAAGSNRRHLDVVEVWDVARGECVHELPGHGYNPLGDPADHLGNPGGVVIVAFSEDSKSLVTVDRKGEVKTWNPYRGELSAPIINLGLPQPLADNFGGTWHQSILSLEHGIFAFGTKGKEPITDQDGNVRSDAAVIIWDVTTGQRRHLQLMHGNPITALGLSPDGQYLISAGRDVKIWDVETGEHVWTIESDTLLESFHTKGITDMQFLPTGHTLVTGSFDTTVKIWDLAAGELIDTLRGHDRPINSLDVSKDGRLLASAANDRAIRVWHLDVAL